MNKLVKFNAVFKGTTRDIYVSPDRVELVYEMSHQGEKVVCIETASKQSMLVSKETVQEVLTKLGLA